MIKLLFDKPYPVYLAASRQPPALPEDNALTQDQLCDLLEEADAVLTQAIKRHDFYSDLVNREAVSDIPALLAEYDNWHSVSYPLREAWAAYYVELGWILASDGDDLEDGGDVDDDDE